MIIRSAPSSVGLILRNILRDTLTAMWCCCIGNAKQAVFHDYRQYLPSLLHSADELQAAATGALNAAGAFHHHRDHGQLLGYLAYYVAWKKG